MSIRILQGDALATLQTLPDASVQCCVTSPPYYGLRDYGVDGQMGLEPTPDEYVAGMVGVFREVRRVLRDDGTFWLNVGDSYANPIKGTGGTNSFQGSNNKGSLFGARSVGMGDAKQKDLLGIPWLLAFALRAPDYLGRIKKETDRSWLAALIDGEGTITILETSSPHGSGNSYPPILQVRMCDIECVAKAAKITGLGLTEPYQHSPSQSGQRGTYHWRLNGKKAADTIAEIYPFLLVKKKQAIVAWNHQLIRDSYETKRGVTIPRGALEKQQLCREIIRKLNAREQVDIPSWMVEPPLPIGPGWYLRSDVIWAKPNPMPESVRDRPTKAHEYVFLLTKSARYFFDAEAVAEETEWPIGSRDDVAQGGFSGKGSGSGQQAFRAIRATRNTRTVWTIATQPYSGAHFATMPPDLAEKCIKAGSKPGDTVLDPFGGAGTTGLVADRLGRDALLIELNPAYADMARGRIHDDAPLLGSVA